MERRRLSPGRPRGLAVAVVVHRLLLHPPPQLPHVRQVNHPLRFEPKERESIAEAVVVRRRRAV